MSNVQSADKLALVCQWFVVRIFLRWCFIFLCEESNEHLAWCIMIAVVLYIFLPFSSQSREITSGETSVFLGLAPSFSRDISWTRIHTPSLHGTVAVNVCMYTSIFLALPKNVAFVGWLVWYDYGKSICTFFSAVAFFAGIFQAHSNKTGEKGRRTPFSRVHNQATPHISWRFAMAWIPADEHEASAPELNIALPVIISSGSGGITATIASTLKSRGQSRSSCGRRKVKLKLHNLNYA